MKISLKSGLEDLLGPADGRYFGAGHRKVTYGVAGARGADADRVDVVGRVDYPSDWSLNSDGTPRLPHLSSVDAVVFAALAAKTLLGQLSSDVESTWIRGVELRGGAAPWLDLLRIPISMTVDHPDGFDPSLPVRAQIGNIRARLDLGTRAGSSSDLDPGDSWSVYGMPANRISPKTTIEVLERDRGVLRACHEFEASPVKFAACPSGIEAAYWPAMTIVDYLVTMGQLTQALVYEVSERGRGQMSNLWMRTMRIDGVAQPETLPTQIITSTELRRDRIIDRPSGRIHDLRVVSLASNGVVAEATLAYTEISDAA